MKELDSYDKVFKIRIHLKYPDYTDILHLEPKERKKELRQRQRNLFKDFTKEINNKKFKRTGSKMSPRGLEMSCSKKEILHFNNDSRVGNISILNIELNKPEENNEYLFAVKARFAIQIENRIKGNQTYEERILLIKAKNGEEAEQKLIPQFKEYEEPYLNSDGALVRWKFETFIDYYQTDYISLGEMQEDENKGIEIFSILKGRRLNEDRIWNGK